MCNMTEIIDNKKEQERAHLHAAIWKIANDLRGSVDGWDFKQHVLSAWYGKSVYHMRLIVTSVLVFGEDTRLRREFRFGKELETGTI